MKAPTKRELEVLELLAHGLTAKKIANKLNISLTTVIYHIENLKAKLDCTNSNELIYKAMRMNLI